MKKKIFKYYYTLIVAIIILMALFSAELTFNVYQNEVENRLKSIAYDIELSLKNEYQNVNKINYDTFAKEFAKIQNQTSLVSLINQHVRVTFVDFSGKVLGDSEANYKLMENHLQRKEIQEAMKGQIGKAVRKSTTLKEDLLYIAVPMKDFNSIVRISIPLKAEMPIKFKIGLVVIFAIIIFGVISVFFSYRISTALTKPLNRIVLAANEISLGNYSSRIEISQEIELKALSEAFNNMAEKLQINIADIKNKEMKITSIVDSISSGILAIDRGYNLILINPVALDFFQIDDDSNVLGKKISSIIRNSRINQLLIDTVEKNVYLEEEIPFAGDRILRINTSPIKVQDEELLNNGGIAHIQDINKIKKLEQIRTDFVSNVTHELKTPLTSIRGFIETLKSGSINDPKRAVRFLDIIDIEAERLNLLIGDTLELSEIEAKKADEDVEVINVKEVVNKVFEISNNLALEKEVSLINNISDGLMICANENRIIQLLLNLVNNAIKYNVEKGSVTVDGNLEPGRVVIKVKDTGIGIAEEHCSRIFERFYRVDKSRSKELGGTGLGLSIVKHIVQLYNGDIKLKSELGKGSEFIISLPQ